MKVNKYLVLHSGDKILISTNLNVPCINTAQNHLNSNLEQELRWFKKDVQESASHIELVLTHKDNQ